MHRIIDWLARSMALLGGAALGLLILLVCVSVAGRTLNTMLHGWIGTLAPDAAQWALDLGAGPVNGDFEIVEVGIAFAIFAFLPLCQVRGGHAVVDIFTARLPPRIDRVLSAIVDTVFAAVLVLIAVQLCGGMLAKHRYGDDTLILQFPVWWGYAASLVPATLAAVVGVYMAAMRIAEAATGREILP